MICAELCDSIALFSCSEMRPVYLTTLVVYIKSSIRLASVLKLGYEIKLNITK